VVSKLRGDDEVLYMEPGNFLNPDSLVNATLPLIEYSRCFVCLFASDDRLTINNLYQQVVLFLQYIVGIERADAIQPLYHSGRQYMNDLQSQIAAGGVNRVRDGTKVLDLG
jgi:hypothetical protein